MLDYGQNARAIEELGIAQISISDLFRTTPLLPPGLAIAQQRRDSNSISTPPIIGSPPLRNATPQPMPTFGSTGAQVDVLEASVASTIVNGRGNVNVASSKVIVPKLKRKNTVAVAPAAEEPRDKTPEAPKIDRSKVSTLYIYANHTCAGDQR